MKRLIAALALCALVFAGCTPPSPDGDETSAPPAAEREFVSGELEILDYQNSLEMRSGKTRSERGIYILEYVGGKYPSYVRLDCVDMLNEVRAPICHLEGCAHDDPDCDAFMPRYGSTPWGVYSYGEMMFIAYTGAWYDYSDPDVITHPAGIDIADADGANRRTLISYDAQIKSSGYDDIPAADDVGSLSIIGDICCDGKYLYYKLRETTAINYVPPEQTTGMNVTSHEFASYLVTLDLASGEEVSRVPYKNTIAFDEWSYMGMYRGKPLSVSTAIDENGKPMHSADGRRYTLCYYTTDFASGKAESVFNSDVDLDSVIGSSGMLFYLNGELYKNRQDEKAIYRCEPETGEFTKVFTAPDEWALFSVRFRDGRYLFSDFSPDGSFRYFVADDFGAPLEEVAMLPGLLQDSFPELTICGESETDFLVISDMVERETPVITTNGEPVTERQNYPVLALISKEDFWNGVPNFRDITG